MLNREGLLTAIQAADKRQWHEENADASQGLQSFVRIMRDDGNVHLNILKPEGLDAADPANRRIEFRVVSTQPLKPTPVDTPSAR